MCPSGDPGRQAAGTVSRYETRLWLAIHRPYTVCRIQEGRSAAIILNDREIGTRRENARSSVYNLYD